jgi:hypothetical protein
MGRAVIGKGGQGVILIRRVAPPVPAKIDRDNPVRASEEFCLGRKMGMIAATPIDEEHRR